MAGDLDSLMALGKGAVSGAGMGAQLGGMAGPQGAAIGAGAGAIIGGIGAVQKQNQADKAQQIPMVDPMERQRLAQLEQQRKALLAGTNAITQNQISEAKNIGAGVQSAVSRNTGGDVASTMDALLRAQKGTQQGVNQAVMSGRDRLPYFDSAAGNLMSRIAQRKLELQRLKRDQAVAENAQARTEANVNANAILGTQGGTATIQEGIGAILPMFTSGQSSPQGNFFTPGDQEIGTQNMMDLLGTMNQGGLFQ